MDGDQRERNRDQRAAAEAELLPPGGSPPTKIAVNTSSTRGPFRSTRARSPSGDVVLGRRDQQDEGRPAMPPGNCEIQYPSRSVDRQPTVEESPSETAGLKCPPDTSPNAQTRPAARARTRTVRREQRDAGFPHGTDDRGRTEENEDERAEELGQVFCHCLHSRTTSCRRTFRSDGRVTSHTGALQSCST